MCKNQRPKRTCNHVYIYIMYIYFIYYIIYIYIIYVYIILCIYSVIYIYMRSVHWQASKLFYATKQKERYLLCCTHATFCCPCPCFICRSMSGSCCCMIHMFPAFPRTGGLARPDRVRVGPGILRPATHLNQRQGRQACRGGGSQQPGISG